MNLDKMFFLICSFVIMSFGLRFILMSKDRLKGKTLQEKDKKKYFIFGIAAYSIGFLILLFFLFITFG